MDQMSNSVLASRFRSLWARIRSLWSQNLKIAHTCEVGRALSLPLSKDEGKRKKKGGGGKTVSSVYLFSLGELMIALHSCDPHFVLTPGDVEPPMIMHQLTCNGVLAGIRICMRGFPYHMLYALYTSWCFRDSKVI